MEAVKQYESIEEWAEVHGLTLDEALEVGVSQRDDGEIEAPRSVWRWVGREVAA